MSNATIAIRTDDHTKKMIADFAASVGLSTSAFATAVLLQAVRKGSVTLTPTLEPNATTAAALREAEADIKAGRNVHGPFKSVSDMAHRSDPLI